MKIVARTVIAVILLCGLDVGCQPAAPPKAIIPAAAPKKSDTENPLVKEALPHLESVLKELLAGDYNSDPTLSPVARKVKGFQSWSFETHEPNPDLPNAVNFGGTLKGPAGEANFTVLMVKQQNGEWMIGTFSGPNPI